MIRRKQPKRKSTKSDIISSTVSLDELFTGRSAQVATTLCIKSCSEEALDRLRRYMKDYSYKPKALLRDKLLDCLDLLEGPEFHLTQEQKTMASEEITSSTEG